MNPIRARLRRYWPRQLMRQVLAVAAIVILLSGAVYSLIAERRIGELSRMSLETQAAALAHSVASGGALHLVTGDAAALEKLLMASASYPGVRAIVVTDVAGRIAAAVTQNAAGEVKPDFELKSIMPPVTTPPARGRLATRNAEQVIEAFASIDNGSRVGWVRADIGMESEREMSANARRDALVSASFISLVTLAVLYLFFGRALRPLARCARFASGLGSSLGSKLVIQSDSIEIEELANALNFASRELNAQMAALATIEALNQSVLDTAADAIIGFDPDGSVTFINPAGCRIFGLEQDDIIGSTMDRLLPDVTSERIARFMQEGVMVGGSSGRNERFDTLGMRNGGVAFPAEVALGLLETADGVRLTCVTRDLSEKKMAEDQLRLFKRALECSANGVVIVDLNYPWLPIIYANAAFERITGYGADEVVGKNCKLLQGNDGDQPEIETLREAVRDGKEATVTLRNYRKDGTMFWNKLSISPVRSTEGTITHFVGIQSDVSSVRRAAQALAEHSARLDALFEMSPDGFVLFEQPGRLVAVNRAFSAMTGLAFDALDGCSVEAFEELLRARCDPQQAYLRVGTLDRPDGAAATAAAAPALLHLMQPERRILQRHVRLTEGGNEMVLYYRDITRESEVDRMKSEFLSTAAHELRTPMVSIYGFSELLLKRKYPEARQKQFFETIYRQTGRLVKLVNELLDLARIEARAGKDFRIEVPAVAPIVRETADALCLPGESRTPQIDLPDDLPLATLDPERFRQALMNVLSNAYKYSPNGGVVRVSAQKKFEGGRSLVGVVVEDHGLGMTPEQVSRAFERFFRADTSGNIPGTGLGLSLVKEIMELQGGGVELSSESGKGTRMVLWLPAAEMQEPVAA